MSEFTLEQIQNDSVFQKITKGSASHMISAAIIAVHPEAHMNSSGYYLVAGYKKMPEFCDDITKIADEDGNVIYHTPKDIEDERLRSPALYHPHAYAARLTPENRTSVLNDYYEWVKDTDIIGSMFEDHGLVLPKVLRTEERNWLVEIDSIANDPGVTSEARRKAQDRICYYFMEQKDVQNPKRKRIAAHYKYIRSDAWLQHNTMGEAGMYNREFREKKQYGNQIIPLSRLIATGADLFSVNIPNDFWNAIVKDLPSHPFVYVSCEKMVETHNPFKEGADAVEKSFSLTLDRVMYCKRVDYPYLCGVMDKAWISLKGMQTPAMDIDLKQVAVGDEPDAYEARLMPIRTFNSFAKQVSERHIPCHIDSECRFLDPEMGTVPVVVRKKDAPFLNAYLRSAENIFVRTSEINKKPEYRRSLGFWEAEAEATKDALRVQAVPQREIDPEIADELVKEAKEGGER